MELFLNLAWAALATLMLVLWLRSGARDGADRRMQFVALAVLVAILLPVISVTDDLQAAQNPAEVDCCVRRAHEGNSAHVILSGTATPPPPGLAILAFGPCIHLVVDSRPAPCVKSPALASIQNRPPPAAV